MFTPDKDGIYAQVDCTGARSYVALGVLGGLGLLLIWLGFAGQARIGGQIGLIVMGALMLVVANWMRQAAHLTVYLTDAGIFDSAGTELAAMADIISIDRGAFAIKPSNGFSLKLRQRAPRAWRPGVWWRVGRRVGVGGIVNAGAAKFMAEQIALRLKS